MRFHRHTSAEKARLQAINARLGKGLRVSLQYDRDAVTRHRSDSTLFIGVDKTVARTPDEPAFCRADSRALQREAAAIAADLVLHLRFARYHDRLVVSYSAYRTLDRMSSDQLCSRMVRASLRTTPLVFHHYEYSLTNL
jgi:hypothetical protein